GSGRVGSLLRTTESLPGLSRRRGRCLDEQRTGPGELLVAPRPLRTGRCDGRGRRNHPPLSALANARPPLVAQAALARPAADVAMPDVAMQPDRAADVARRGRGEPAVRR